MPILLLLLRRVSRGRAVGPARLGLRAHERAQRLNLLLDRGEACVRDSFGHLLLDLPRHQRVLVTGGHERRDVDSGEIGTAVRAVDDRALLLAEGRGADTSHHRPHALDQLFVFPTLARDDGRQQPLDDPVELA